MPTEPDLPDDINLWPSEPNALFGLDADASRRDLKRAYTRLIRRFKPEHFPDQFRRLREAYDAFDQMLEWREMIAHRQISDLVPEEAQTITWDRSEDPPADSRKESGQEAAKESSGVPEPHPDRPVKTSAGRPAVSDEDQIWNQGLDGSPTDVVYAKLVDLSHKRQLSEAGYARLYWLLTLQPQLDSERDPCTWLIEGSQYHGLGHPLLTILTIDVRRRSGDVPLLIHADLFDLAKSARQIVDLAAIRWLVARRLSRFDVIRTDLDRLRRRFLDEPDEWIALLNAAVNQLILVRSRNAVELLNDVQGEIDLAPTNLEANWLWDWHDSMIQLHDVWIDVVLPKINTIEFTDLYGRPSSIKNLRVVETRDLLQKLVKLVAITWDDSLLHRKVVVRSFCAELLSEAASSLDDLTVINRVAHPLMIRLWGLIQEQTSESFDDRFEMGPGTEREIQFFVRRHLWSINRWDVSVLRFCRQSAVLPHEIADAIEESHEALPECSLSLAASIRNHLPLICLIEGERLL